MKTIYKILLLCLLVFALSLFATKKSIDHTFRKVECSQTDNTASITLYNYSESVEV